MKGDKLGFPGSPQTANQLGEAVNAVKQGVKSFEVTLLSPETAETIPKQHFREMRQLMKLSGVKPSVHGAIIDAAGFTQQGWGGDQTVEDNERRMFHSIESAYELDSSGKIPVVFHSSNGAPGGELRPGNGKVVRAVINQETGEVVPMKEKRKYSPTRPGELKEKDIKKAGYLFTPEDQIVSANATDWDKKLTELATFNKHANELIDDNALHFADYQGWSLTSTKEGHPIMKNPETGEIKEISPTDFKAFSNLKKGGIFLENVELNFHSAFDTAFQYGTDKQREELRKLSEDYAKAVEGLQKEMIKRDEKGESIDPFTLYYGKEKLLEDSIERLHRITKGKAPEVYKDAEDFAMEKASKTFGNLAFKSYDKYEDKAPVIAIENMFQGFAFTDKKEMKQLIEKSRENFIDRLVEEKNMNRKRAEKIAEEKIGMTLDVGHLNIVKKSGFDDKYIQEYTETVAPYVKHLHLTDNFGYADTHLAPGMGNVPFKEILKTLEKKGKLDEMRKIVESGAFVQHFKQSPHAITLAAFNSPIYGAKMAPKWGDNAYQIGGNYFGGYGTSNPAIHHSIYGSGFTTLPTEFGGNMPGNGSRFSGRGMA